MSETARASLDTLPEGRALRSVLGRFATGVTVVTTAHEGQLHGMTANSFTSVSLDPPLVLVCFDVRSRTAAAVTGSGEFVINILDEAQAPVSQRFAMAAEDHFLGTAYRLDDHGMPILLGGLGHLACEVHEIHLAGDHDVVIGRIRHAATRDGTPLVFFSGSYRHLADAAAEPDKR